eukprot:NODE_212_length_12593_cov_0.662638.p5 type:complete len:323 gc:universal NODE_212_length_12593_cov_0.662638:4730-3762(-)
MKLAVHPSKVQQIKLALEKSKIILLCGPSGCGKTELIKHLCPGLIEITTNATDFDFSDSKLLFEEYLTQIREAALFQNKAVLLIEDLPPLWTPNQVLKFHKVIQMANKKVVIIYNTSLRDPYELHKYKIDGANIIYMNPTPNTQLKAALEANLGLKITTKALEKYFKYAQGDIRQFIIAYQNNLCPESDLLMSLSEYCTFLLCGSLPKNVRHYHPYLVIPYIQYNCVSSFVEFEDIVETLDWCSNNTALLNQLELDTINNLYLDELNLMHSKFRKGSLEEILVNPFKIQTGVCGKNSVFEKKLKSIPKPVTFSDDDSIEDEE